MDRPLLSGTLGPPLVNSCSEEGASVPITPVGPVGLLHCIQNVLIGVATRVLQQSAKRSRQEQG
jgi:hypothetical protein